MNEIKKNRTLILGVIALFVALYWWMSKNGIEFMSGNLNIPDSEPAPVPETTPSPAAETAQANFASVSLIPEMNDVVRDDAFDLAPKKMTDQQFVFDANKYGENTQGSSLRNANQQLRSDPPIEKTIVCPWMNSTIEPDPYRLPLE